MEKWNWTEAKIEQLKRWHEEGLNRTEMADNWGVSRNVVSGKSIRLGLKIKAETLIRSKIKASAQGHANNKKRVIYRYMPSNGKRHAPSPTALPIEEDAPPSRSLTILQLTNTTCKWPTSYTDQHLFCGIPTKRGERIWCSFHRKKAWVPAKKR